MVLVIAVGDNIFFDPSREALAVADAVVAVSFVRRRERGERFGCDKCGAARTADCGYG